MSQLQSSTAFSGPRARIGNTDTGPAARGDDIVDIRRIIGVVWQQRRLIASTMLAGLLLGLLYSLVVPAKFVATATVLFEPREQVLIAKEGIGQPRIDGSQVDNQVEIIQSSDVIARAVRLLAPNSRPSAETDGAAATAALAPPAQAGPPGATGAAAAPPVQNIVVTQDDIDWFRRLMRIKRRQDTHLIDISFYSSQPAEAARLANGLARTYIDMQIKARAEEIREFNNWLAGRLVELSGTVVASEKQMEDHKAKHNLLDPSAITDIERRLFQINEQLELGRLQADAARDRLARVKELAVVDGIDPVKLKQFRSERINEMVAALGEVSKREDEAAAKPALVTALQERRRQIEAEIGREVERLVASAEELANGSREQVKRLEAQKIELQGVRDRQTDAAIKLRELAEQVEVNRALNRAFDTRARELSAQLALLKPSVQIVAQAIEPTRKNSPGLVTVMALALLASGALGIGGALVAEQVNRTIRTLGDVEKETGLPPLGMLGFEPGLQTDPFARSSPAAEDLLRSVGWGAALFRGKEPPKVVAFVSAEEQEGRSTLAASFAAFHARRGLRVLLIDADLRRPRLTTFLGRSLTFATGLNELLLEGLPFDRISMAEVGGPKLVFMPATAGKEAGNPDALINPQFPALLDGKRAGFDLIVVDTPPLTTSAEARFVLECCDRAVLVVRNASTSPVAVRTALQMSRAPLDRFAGALLNAGGGAPGPWNERLKDVPVIGRVLGGRSAAKKA